MLISQYFLVSPPFVLYVLPVKDRVCTGGKMCVRE